MNTISLKEKAIVQSLGLSNASIYLKAYELVSAISSRGKLLDFGAGQGRFLEMIGNLNFTQMSGVDLMKRPNQKSQNYDWIEADLNEKLPITEDNFDIIVGIEVIEHLENPRAMVRELYRLLKPGGNLILSTPNNESIRSILSLIFRGHFVSFLNKDYPAHITALTALDLTRILNESNFSKIQTYYTDSGLIPSLAGVSWQVISGGFLKGKRFSDNVFVVARK